MRKPYTLVEILVAVSIIGILTATGLGVTGYVRNKIADTQTRTTFNGVAEISRNVFFLSEDDRRCCVPQFSPLDYGKKHLNEFNRPAIL